MKILHVLPTRDINYGGPVQVAESLVHSLLSKGHEARVLPSGYGRGRFFWPGLHGISEVMAGIDWADLVHIHGLWTVPTTLAAILARRGVRPYIVSAHGMLDRWSLQRSHVKKRIYAAAVEKRGLNHSAGIHFLTKEEFEEAREYGLWAPAFVVGNGVRVEEFSGLPAREVLDARYPQVKGKVVALFLGRIHPKKGFDVLVPALKLARTQVPSLHLLIAGPDENGYRVTVERAVHEAGLANAVDFVGGTFGEQKRMILGGADFFVLPSYQEGDSVAVKEALAAGLPIIVSTACRCTEAAIERAGLVVKPEVDAVANSLVNLGMDARKRKIMGMNATTLAHSRYQWDKIVDKFISVYADILTGQRNSECWCPNTDSPRAPVDTA